MSGPFLWDRTELPQPFDIQIDRLLSGKNGFDDIGCKKGKRQEPRDIGSVDG